MQFKHIKRGISLLLVLAMVFSMLPMQAHADETAHDHTVHAEASAEAELSMYLQLQHEADGLLKEHLLTLSMSPEQIRSAVDAMPDGSLAAARAGIEAMLGRFRQLSEEELLRFEEGNPEFVEFSGAVMAHDTALEPMATSGTVLGGQITVTDTASKVSVSGGTVTVTVTGSGGLTSGKTGSNTVTVTNTSGSMAAVSFDYDCSASGTFTFSEASNSGSWSGMMEAGASKTMTMTATGGALFKSSTATLKLTNFTLATAQESSRVTVEYDSARGRVTADGTAVDPGTTLEGVTPGEGAVLVAEPASGYTFACWIDSASGKIAARDASYSIYPTQDVTVEAVFLPKGSDACFRIGNTPYFDLNDAVAAAKSGDVITLVNNGTLCAGEYTIPSGITLLIPFDEGGSAFTTDPESAASVSTPLGLPHPDPGRRRESDRQRHPECPRAALPQRRQTCGQVRPHGTERGQHGQGQRKALCLWLHHRQGQREDHVRRKCV